MFSIQLWELNCRTFVLLKQLLEGNYFGLSWRLQHPGGTLSPFHPVIRCKTLPPQAGTIWIFSII